MVEQNLTGDEQNAKKMNLVDDSQETSETTNQEFVSKKKDNGAEGFSGNGAQHDDDSQELTELDTEQSLRLRVEELEAELSEQKNEFLLSRADLENSRRRMEKDKQTFLKYGLEGMLKDLLPCIDSFEQAIGQSHLGEDGVSEAKDSESKTKAFRDGVLLVKKQLSEVLAKHGLTQVESEGCEFDPDLHQAIRKEESDDVEKEMVGETYQHGFMLHDRLIRPAMVSVLMPKT